MLLVAFLLVSFQLSPTPAFSLPIRPDSDRHSPANQTLKPPQELHKLTSARAYLRKINKPSIKTIQAFSFSTIFLQTQTSPVFYRNVTFHPISREIFNTICEKVSENIRVERNISIRYSPDGDIIDCVLTHLQPAFDHPELKGKKPLDPPERPKSSNETKDRVAETFQLWTESGESCPDGTIPIRRTTENDILRASSIGRFARKPRRHVRRDSTGSGHEHAVVFVNGDQYYGAKASINVWTPRVTDQYEFSLSQIWVISGSFGNDLNTIEADAYQATGCYNLLCSGFVQTNNKIAIGAAISPRSSYNGRQFDIGLMVWKDPKHGHWWLEFGNGLLVGYWPAFLFSHLRSHASMIQFGGEIVNSRSSGYHTSTQMGSGHFAEEGFGKASYFRNLQVVDWDNNLLPLTNLHLLADHPNCYDIKQGRNGVWGTYFYYGGPGRNVRCP
ncbi:hypothetical protein L484_014572 [Morus notabilis]|uniref:Neprosin PEP catalytic domain-containing protein n=1 Tax=Morus notabilis TaxID=981085 RepID=W9S7K2_9ROSA|nr:hypothetical protein L484_014572 [Morus notabilis]